MRRTDKKAVAIAVQAGVPVLLWGTPGIGKTTFIYGLGKVLGVNVHVVIASLRDPTDFLGLPFKEGNVTRYAPPAWATEVEEGDIVFFDEINTAPPAVQAALLRVVLEGIIGEYKLPNVRFVAAANPPEFATAYGDLGSALANRFIHLNVAADAEEFVLGFTKGWDDEKIVKEVVAKKATNIAEAKAMVAAFIAAKPELLNKPVPGALAYPTPRSWEFVAKILAVIEATDLKRDEKINVLQKLVEGAVGPGAAAEFVAWYEAKDLIEPKALLEDPAKYKEKVAAMRQDQMYSIVTSAAAYVTAHMSEEMWQKFWKVVEVLVNVVPKDILAVAVRIVAKAAPDYEVPDVVEVFADLL